MIFLHEGKIMLRDVFYALMWVVLTGVAITILLILYTVA